MYLPDLSPFPTDSHQPAMIAIGWLDPEHAYQTGTVPSAFFHRLRSFCLHPNIGSMGFHACAFCPSEIHSHRPKLDGKSLGGCEIVAFDQAGTRYIAPDLIYHYVRDHQYCPPAEFIAAVLYGPLPPSRLYQERMVREVFFPDDSDRRNQAMAQFVRETRALPFRLRLEYILHRLRWLSW